MNECYNLPVDQGVTSTLTHLTKTADGGRIMADREVTAKAALYQCKSCERHQTADAFYVSNQSRCKECVKISVRKNRAEKIEYYRSYDRLRYRQDENRKELCKAMGKTTPMAKRIEKQRDRRRADPQKAAARRAVNYAVRSGKLIRPSGCFFCGEAGNLQAHHHDYSRPLDVFWLCPACHGKLHTINGDFLRPKPGTRA